MSTLSDQYRQMAAKARSEADAAKLPNVQQLHPRSAERLNQIAQGLENVAKAKVRNEAAKLAEGCARHCQTKCTRE